MGRVNPADIKNKVKRSEVFAKRKAEKAQARKDAKKHREVEAQELGEEPVRPAPKTLDNTRVADVTVVSPEDVEVVGDEMEDEFSEIFANEATPKLMVTTRPKPSAELFHFIGDLLEMIPNAFYYPRKTHSVATISGWAAKRGFTHLLVLSENAKVCNGMVVCVLPAGPTAFFKVSNVMPRKAISNHGRITAHQPELILNNFGTRLGHRVGRFLGSLFPHDPQFEGRQVVTFHNQRDFIFVRHHRYIFDESKAKTKDKEKNGAQMRTRLQELGPRFTLKLRWLQEGSFDPQFGEYEWIHKRKEMDKTRRTFHL